MIEKAIAIYRNQQKTVPGTWRNTLTVNFGRANPIRTSQRISGHASLSHP